MTQMGMNMPGGIRRRGPEMNVYTGLLAFAVVTLAIACVILWMQGSKIGGNGNPLELQVKDKVVFSK